MKEKTHEGGGKSFDRQVLFKVLCVVFLLFVFLIGVSSLSASFRMMGSGFASTLFTVSSHPVISLFAGMLATAMIQSSSTSTSIIVGLCSSGALSISGAVPMIMGANIGTSVTNTIVSMGYAKNRENLNKAFTAATVHDIFNVLSVLVLLPLELATGLIEKSATLLADALYGAFSSVKINSPVKSAIKPITKGLRDFVLDVLGVEGNAAGVVLMLLAAIIIVFSLLSIVKITKTFLNANRSNTMEKLLSKTPMCPCSTGLGSPLSFSRVLSPLLSWFPSQVWDCFLPEPFFP